MKIRKFFTFINRSVSVCTPEELRAGVKEVYSTAAKKPLGKHPFPVGRKFAESIGYPSSLLDNMPDIVWEAFVGVSNVAVFADIPGGAVILDIGCGSGLDTIIAAERTGSSGRVIGIDFSEDMLSRAKKATYIMGIESRVEFHCATAEELPLVDKSVDIILVNGIFNLNPDRDKLFRELARVIKERGKVYVAEMIFTEPVVTKNVCNLDDWFA